jgi:hypothetical protein
MNNLLSFDVTRVHRKRSDLGLTKTTCPLPSNSWGDGDTQRERRYHKPYKSKKLGGHADIENRI